jgi:hypothetical protein
MMVEVAESRPTVKLVGSYRIYGEQTVRDGPPFPEVTLDGKETCKLFFEGRPLLASETNHLIRISGETDLNHLFNETFLHADIELWVRLLINNGEYGFVHQVLTFTRVHRRTLSEHSHSMGTNILEYLMILQTYGAEFLGEQAYRTLLRKYRRAHAEVLFRALMKVWNRETWRHHVRKSQELGVQIAASELIRAGIVDVGRSLFSPVTAVQRLRRELERLSASRSRKRDQPE